MNMPELKWSNKTMEQAWQAVPLEARASQHPYIGVEHVALSLTRCQGGFTERLLARLQISAKDFRELIRVAAGGARIAGPDDATPRLQTMLTALRSAGNGHIGERPLLLALLDLDGGVLATVCEEQQWSRQDMRSAVADDTGAEATSYTEPTVPVIMAFPLAPLAAMQAAQGRSPLHEHRQHGMPFLRPGSSALEEFGRDLTAEAQAGGLSEAFGRRDIIVRMAGVLAHQMTNNPVLVGEAGVGKTAIVEGFAWRLAQRDRPIQEAYRLTDSRIIEISISRLSAGTELRGSFELRLQRIIDEASSDPRVILFFDELHTLVGAGKVSGALDASQILKPALARGAFRCIGATTANDFERFIAGDSALARRFERIEVPELSEVAMLPLLHQWRVAYEQQYRVTFHDEALQQAIRLSVRYLPNRRLPEKALKVLDTARVLASVSGDRLSIDISRGSPENAGAAIGLGQQTVTVQHVEQAITQMTGIPVLPDGADNTRLLGLAKTLSQRIIGQEAAVKRVSAVIQSAFAGLQDPERPKAVLLFCGPTGVGKTELASALAEVVCGSGNFQAFDMAEFSEPHTVARLIGAPPGYVGYDQGGELTNWLRQHPHSLVLLDEIEKADQQVLDFLLGLFSAGRMADGRGRQAWGREAIFVMTSNLPLKSPSETAPLGFPTPSSSYSNLDIRVMREQAAQFSSLDDRAIRDQLRKHMRAEFVGRIDEVILFQPLDDEAITRIVGLRLGELRLRLMQTRHVSDVTFTDEVYRLIASRGASPQSGAREIAATIRHLVNEPVSRALMSASTNPAGKTIEVSVDRDDHIQATLT